MLFLFFLLFRLKFSHPMKESDIAASLETAEIIFLFWWLAGWHLVDRISNTCPHYLVVAKTPSWTVTSQDREQLHVKEHKSKWEKCTVQPGSAYSIACLKFSIISLALQCTNHTLDRSPVFQMVKNFFQWLLAVRVHSCINLQNWPAQEFAAHRDHLWMKYLPSSAAKVKSTSWLV